MGKYLTVGLIVLLVILGIGGIAWFYLFVLSQIPGLRWLRLLITVGAAGLAVAMVSVGLERIREIDREEKDDLGKY